MRIFLIIILFLNVSILAKAQELVPPIYNYEVYEYNAASQNWGVDVTEDGELFVANHKGLLHFNGEKWNLNKLPNNTIIRSVAVIGDSIYTGSYEEFGYWKKNEIGKLTYHSLTHLIKNHEFTSEEFWEIIAHKNKILFRSFSTIYRYADDTIEVIDVPETITDFVSIEDKIIIAAKNKGIFELTQDKFIPLENQELLRDKTISDMTMYQGGLLIGTKLNGCFIYKDGKISEWNEKLNSSLKKHQLNKISYIPPDKIIFGTIKNGIYIYNIHSNSTTSVHKRNGLQNNTVLAMKKFQGQLWIGLDSGIDRINLDAAIKYYTDPSGALGTVYDIEVLDSVVYLGSNTGIYYIKDNVLNFVQGSQGHVWDLEVLDGQLFCGHNTGTFILEDTTFKKVSDFSGGYQIIKIPENPRTFLQGTYTGIIKYSKNDNGEWSVSRIKNSNIPVKQLCFEDASSLWIAHPYKGFYKVKLDEKYNSIVETKSYQIDSTENNYNIKLFSIKNQIVFQSKGKWYRYDSILDKIVSFEEFEKYKGQELIHFGEEYFWFFNTTNPKQIIYSDLKNDSLSISENQLNNRLVPDAEKMIKLKDSSYLITLSDGYGQINFKKLHQESSEYTLVSPKIYAFRDQKEAYPLNSDLIQIPFGHSKEIAVEIASPALINPHYYYSLSGAAEQSALINEGMISFQNLPYGNYYLELYTVGTDNSKSIPTILSFEIAPPWYLSRLSIFIYVLGIIGLFIFIRKYNRAKLNKKHQELKVYLEKEHKEKLAAKEREKLIKEIKVKQTELAETTMNIAKKNEVILELKSMLLLNKEKFSNQPRYKSIIKKVNESVNNTEDWKRFELNFKELHEDFFENLLKHYPDLTPKDLKLCAYLKMNLSSKEIAPLMAITNRGVEIHRYRLRKKLKIDSSQNLSNFLITFK